VGARIPIPPFEVEGAAWSDPGVQFEIADEIRKACGDGTVCLTAASKVTPLPDPKPDEDCIILELPPAGALVARGSTIVFVINNDCDPA
jgi:hypothetical protein